MGIVNTDVYGVAAQNAVDLAIVTENLMDIRVASGTCKIASVDRVLPTAAVHTCTADPTDATEVRGFLVRDTSTEAIEVLVDETVLDGADAGYSFDDGAYEALAVLFNLIVPAAATDITSETINVRRIVAPPE